MPDNCPSLLDCVVICEADERVNVSSLLVGLWGWVVRAECRREDRENATGYATFGMQMLVKGRKVSLDHARDKMGRASQGWKLKLTFRGQVSLLWLGAA